MNFPFKHGLFLGDIRSFPRGDKGFQSDEFFHSTEAPAPKRKAGNSSSKYPFQGLCLFQGG